ncbi:MAG: SpoIIE family protein phosphatase [Treponema sp.]|nr:SpoIIE family protein phosphatase [Treponema sp.]
MFSVLIASALPADDFHWEEVQIFSAGAGTFPVSAHSDGFSAVAWQNVTPNAEASSGGNININLAVKNTYGNWEQRGAVAGPYIFMGAEPSILSMVIDNSGNIIIAAAAGNARTDILISSDRGHSFTRHSVDMDAENSVAPRIFVRADGGYLLFTARGRSQSLTIFYSRSDDGIEWSSFEPFVTESNLSFNFLPSHASSDETDIVFFQSRLSGIESIATFQLYYKISHNGGRTWTEARRFTVFNDPVIQTQASANNFDNQRPHLVKYNNNFLLVWERRYTSQSPQIYSAVINSNGGVIGSVERINNTEANCQNPIGFIHNGAPAIVWFDTRSGYNRVIIAQRDDYTWQNYQLSGTSMEASFARPVVTGGGIYIFWQAALRGTERIYMLSPDHSAASPMITALNFRPAIASRTERPRVAWNIPSDTSGIAGFSWMWSRDKNDEPRQELMIYNTGMISNLNMELFADNDGEWYFTVIARDNAGNWSPPAQMMFYRKNTPPSPVKIIEPEVDERGFLNSNTFGISWEPSDDPFADGYTWNLQYLGVAANIGQSSAYENISAASVPSINMGADTSANYVNQDNGAWAFTVSAIDSAGNIGLPAGIIIRINKFIPYTNISNVDARQDDQGVLAIRITGRGFTTDGQITEIALTQNGKPEITTDSFNIVSDREINGIVFENMEEGQYSLRINHSGRGWYSTNTPINAARTGTVKMGDYSREWRTSWRLQSDGLITLNPVTVLIIILMIFSVIGLTAVIRGIGGIIAESALIRQETLAIITGDIMPMEKKQKVIQIQKKGRGLRFKLASFTIALVLLVVIMISTPMYIIMTQRQQSTLLEGLKNRAGVLLEGTASSARSYLPMAIQSLGERGALELMFLPSQSAAIIEANYITITGYGLGSIHTDHVWATNDPDITAKIDTTEFRRGISRLSDNLSPLYEEISNSLNSRAQNEAGALSESIRDLYEQGMELALRTDAEAERMRDDIQVAITAKEVELNQILSEISKKTGSYPEFSVVNLPSDNNRVFIFYKPIMYRQGADNNFFRGLIRLEVSLDTIISEINEGQITLLATIGIVALAVLLIGIIGAFTFAAVIIRPIRNLVRHIETIRDTDDKSKLAGMDINIKTKDEIAILGNTINDMTHGLVKASLAASDLSIGKEIQKKFIPLEMDSQGNKQSSGFKSSPNLHFFGYYEGAKGVSGDYFDYKDLDGRYYAVIKCDVAGKGIPAALIMIQVATMFLNYFKQWKPNAKGMHIEEVVYQINDFIETLGFKGRFAAFTLCLLDSETGICRFCNAGDNILHLYSASERRIKTITLPQTPATGVLPNFMIESTGGYNVQTVQIEKGDILLLYTDGIEEAKRKFRNREFKEITCREGKADTPHENHLCGQADEEMGPRRVEAIINAVMAKEVYTLRKFHNPEGEIELQFDFSDCESRVEDVIMAMVSVEKMFRCYKPENAGEDSRVLVDKKVDEFLKGHFIQYRRYCAHTRENPENPAYMYYTHVKEDEQYDDLTILGIKRR